MRVIDASVVYKWYITGAGTEQAVGILEGLRCGAESLAAPDLILYELASALRHNPKVKSEDAESVLENFISLKIEIIIPSLTMLKDGVRLALRHQISVYDAIYITLAKSLGCDFVTADKRLRRKLSHLSFVQAI